MIDLLKHTETGSLIFAQNETNLWSDEPSHLPRVRAKIIDTICEFDPLLVLGSSRYCLEVLSPTGYGYVYKTRVT